MRRGGGGGVIGALTSLAFLWQLQLSRRSRRLGAARGRAASAVKCAPEPFLFPDFLLFLCVRARVCENENEEVSECKSKRVYLDARLRLFYLHLPIYLHPATRPRACARALVHALPAVTFSAGGHRISGVSWPRRPPASAPEPRLHRLPR